MNGETVSDILRLVGPLVTLALCIVLPALVKAAINGEFASFRNEEVARMTAHNENEDSHPRLRTLSELEERIEKAFGDVRAELQGLRREIGELKEAIACVPTKKVDRSDGRRKR